MPKSSKGRKMMDLSAQDRMLRRAGSAIAKSNLSAQRDKMRNADAPNVGAYGGMPGKVKGGTTFRPKTALIVYGKQGINKAYGFNKKK